MIRYEENDGFPIDKSCVNDRMPGAVFNVGLREADGLIQVRARGYITATGDPAETGELVDFAAPSVSLSVLGQRGSSAENEISSGTIGVINGESRLIRIFATDRVIYSTGFALEPIPVAGASFAFVNPAGIIVNLDDLFSSGGEELIDIEELEEIDPAIFTAIDNFAFDNVSILLPPDQRFDEEDEDEI